MNSLMSWSSAAPRRSRHLDTGHRRCSSDHQMSKRHGVHYEKVMPKFLSKLRDTGASLQEKAKLFDKRKLRDDSEDEDEQSDEKPLVLDEQEKPEEESDKAKGEEQAFDSKKARDLLARTRERKEIKQNKGNASNSRESNKSKNSVEKKAKRQLLSFQDEE